MQTFLVHLRHDRGNVVIEHPATDSDAAVKAVLAAEGAPWAAFRAVYAADPTPDVSGRHGAPMGRPSAGPFSSNPVLWRAARVRLTRGGYDPGGAYWGLRQRGKYLYAVQDGEGRTSFVDARDAREAKAKLNQAEA